MNRNYIPSLKLIEIDKDNTVPGPEAFLDYGKKTFKELDDTYTIVVRFLPWSMSFTPNKNVKFWELGMEEKLENGIFYECLYPLETQNYRTKLPMSSEDFMGENPIVNSMMLSAGSAAFDSLADTLLQEIKNRKKCNILLTYLSQDYIHFEPLHTLSYMGLFLGNMQYTLTSLLKKRGKGTFNVCVLLLSNYKANYVRRIKKQ